MKLAVFLAGTLTFVILSACSHKDDFIIPDGYNAYPLKYLDEDKRQWAALTYNEYKKPEIVVLFITTVKFKYLSGTDAGLTLSFTSPNAGSSYGYAYTFNRGPDGLPVSGIRTYSPESSSRSGYSYYTDSILYRTANGKISEVRFYNRVATSVSYTPIPGSTTYSYDTLEVYHITYQGENISKIHAENRTNGKITDHEFIYGTAKGAFHDLAALNLTIPDQLIQQGYKLFNLYAKNDLVTYRFSQGTQKTVTNYTYTLNKYKYPESVVAIDSANSINREFTGFGY